uniref:Uncharacterized protein n=1 Tax=Anguilla anguilla TaxID=7936 RepID=A0A0E9TTR0_ANGAN
MSLWRQKPKKEYYMWRLGTVHTFWLTPKWTLYHGAKKKAT